MSTILDDLAEESVAYQDALAVAQNHRFLDAMMRAIKRGLERPPMIGIDRRPCTQNPVYVPHAKPAVFPTSSAATAFDF